MNRKTPVVRVDPDVCVGNSMCRATAPNVFVADDNEQSVVADPAADSLEKILEAAANCPVGAIFVEDPDTHEPLFP